MLAMYWLIAALLIANMLLGLVRIASGPTRTDRLLAVQLLSTTTVAITLLLAETLALPALRDVALLIALLAAMVSLAYVRLRPPDFGGPRR
jgi:multicomponent Na+:H+ antiporter subunit F